MEETKGMSLFAYIIAFVIIVWVINAMTNGCGFGGFGACNRAYGVGVDGYGLGFEDYKAICESQKANIANTATTLYNIEKQARDTQTVVTAQSNALATKIDFYEYQNLRDKVSERDREIMELKNQLFVKDQLAPINAQLANIDCKMLKQPNVYGLATSCNTIFTPALNTGCNGCNGCNSIV